jgi:hypothetical protein
MTVKPKGGRGLKAPYETTILRVPLPLVGRFQAQVDEFRDLAINGVEDSSDPATVVLSRLGNDKLTRLEVVEKAKVILRRRKSAKESLTKLLQVIYNDKTIIL